MWRDDADALIYSQSQEKLPVKLENHSTRPPKPAQLQVHSVKLYVDRDGIRTSMVSYASQGASIIGRYARQGPTADAYCLAIVLTI
jgi:hypothetical protein